MTGEPTIRIGNRDYNNYEAVQDVKNSCKRLSENAEACYKNTLAGNLPSHSFNICLPTWGFRFNLGILTYLSPLLSPVLFFIISLNWLDYDLSGGSDIIAGVIYVISLVLYYFIKLILIIRKAKNSRGMYDNIINFVAKHKYSIVFYIYIVLIYVVIILCTGVYYDYK